MASSSVILPFLMSMLLGRSIDLTSYTISGNVYDDAEYTETPVSTLATTYNVLQDDVFPFSQFGIPVDIVLRIKSGFLSSSSGAMGLEGLLKDTTWKFNSVVVSATTVYRTVTRSLLNTSDPLPDWSAKIPPTQTHYASSLFYGGWSVVLFRFQCDIPGDVHAVRKVLTRHLGVEGELTNDTIGVWKKAMSDIEADEDIRGSVAVTPLVFSTVPLRDSVTTFDSLPEVTSRLPELVGPLGQPIYMELKPLHQLDGKFPVAKENSEMLTELEKLDQMLDDVKITKSSIMKWLTETLTVFEDAQEEKIYKLLNIVNGCIRAFNKVGGDASLFKSMDRGLLDSAYHAYLSGLERGIANYNLAFRRLKEEIDADCETAFLHKIRGLLRVYDTEMVAKGKVDGGVAECQRLCTAEPRCRAIGYAHSMTELDLATGLYYRKEKQCWIYFRSTSTATVHTPSGLSGDLAVYDRKCY